MSEEIVAVAQASALRRLAGVGLLMVASAAIIYVALTSPPQPVLQAVLIGGGVLGLWLAMRMHAATGSALELTETELRDSAGQRIVLVADIVSLDRGFLAFKPSHGFLIKTRTPAPWVWQPGMWWRFGRRIGVGGVLPARQTKAISGKIALMLATRDQMSDHTT